MQRGQREGGKAEGDQKNQSGNRKQYSPHKCSGIHACTEAEVGIS